MINPADLDEFGLHWSAGPVELVRSRTIPWGPVPRPWGQLSPHPFSPPLPWVRVGILITLEGEAVIADCRCCGAHRENGVDLRSQNAPLSVDEYAEIASAWLTEEHAHCPTHPVEHLRPELGEDLARDAARYAGNSSIIWLLTDDGGVLWSPVEAGMMETELLRALARDSLRTRGLDLVAAVLTTPVRKVAYATLATARSADPAEYLHVVHLAEPTIGVVLQTGSAIHYGLREEGIVCWDEELRLDASPIRGLHAL